MLRSLHFNNCTFEPIDFPRKIVHLKRFISLKYLIFIKIRFEGGKLPKGIGRLIHLKSLCLKACEVDELPLSVRNLVYLDTLNLELSKNVRIPNNVLNKVFALKHLMLPYYDVDMKSQTLKLDGLDHLETLTGFNSLVHKLKTKKGMNLLHFEGVVHNKRSLSKVMDAISKNKRSLVSGRVTVTRDCIVSPSEEGDLMKLFTWPNFRYVHTSAPIGNLLRRLEHEVHASNLVYLTLDNCGIQDDPMPILGKLNVLKELKVIDTSFIGEVMTCHTSLFPSLASLSLVDLANLGNWRVERGCMSNVVVIKICKCPNLKMLPHGLAFLRSLRSLWIGETPQLTSRVIEGGPDFEKVQHVQDLFTF